jgi:SAM-dependent methyltransferase
VSKEAEHSPYYRSEAIKAGVAAGGHRDIIGGMWEEIGALQFDFMRAQGLRPDHKLLDVGCGCLRGGVHFIRYLAPGHYFGLDMNQSLLDAGLQVELPREGLEGRLPPENLVCDAAFDFGRFPERFDYAVAVSLFTHLPLNTIRVCLERLHEVVVPGGVFFATFFAAPEDAATWRPVQRKLGIVTHADADPYHCRASDLAFAAAGLPWRARYVGEFGHPRGQVMMAFERL